MQRRKCSASSGPRLHCSKRASDKMVYSTTSLGPPIFGVAHRPERQENQANTEKREHQPGPAARNEGKIAPKSGA
jgi:hypothetical protein